MCKQTAGCNAGTAAADGHRAWWKLPLGMDALTTESMCRQTAGCNAGTARAEAMCTQTADGNTGTAEAYGHRAWWKPWTM